jgi:hypothetical protein
MADDNDTPPAAAPAPEPKAQREARFLGTRPRLGTFALDGETMSLAEAETQNQKMNQIYAELDAGDTSNRERLFELLRDKIDAPEPPDLRVYD